MKHDELDDGDIQSLAAVLDLFGRFADEDGDGLDPKRSFESFLRYGSCFADSNKEGGGESPPRLRG